MNLYLLRHGVAVERGDLDLSGDEARPLTAKGRRQLRKVAAALRAMKIKPDLVLSSPLIRAQQTAEVVAKHLKLRGQTVFNYELRPGGSPEKLIRQLVARKPVPGEVLIVGHEPDLSELLSLLVGGNTTGGFSFKKAGLAKLEIERLRPNQCATLAWLLTPAQMKLMD